MSAFYFHSGIPRRRKLLQPQQHSFVRTDGTRKKLPPTPMKQSNIVLGRKPVSLPATPGRQLPRMKSPLEERYCPKSNYNEDYNYAYHSQDNLQQGVYSNNTYTDQSFNQLHITNTISDNYNKTSYASQLPNLYEQPHFNTQKEDTYKSMETYSQNSYADHNEHYDQPCTGSYQHDYGHIFPDSTYPKVSESFSTHRNEKSQDVVMLESFFDKSYAQNNIEQSFQCIIEKSKQDNQYTEKYTEQFPRSQNSDKDFYEIHPNDEYQGNLYDNDADQTQQNTQYKDKYLDQSSQDNIFKEKYSDSSFTDKYYREKYDDQSYQDNQYPTYSESVSTTLYDQTTITDITINYDQFEENQYDHQHNSVTTTAYEEPCHDTYQQTPVSITLTQVNYQDSNKKQDYTDYIPYSKEDTIHENNHQNQYQEHKEQYDDSYQDSYPNSFEDQYNGSTSSSTDQRKINVLELSVNTLRDQMKSNAYPMELGCFYPQKNIHDLSMLNLEKRKKLNDFDTSPPLQQKIDSSESRDNELKDSFETVVSSFDSSQPRKLFSEYSTAGESSSVLTTLASSPQNHTQVPILISNQIVNHNDETATKEDRSCENVVTNNKNLTRTESYQEEVMDDDEYPEILSKQYQRKDSQLSHQSYQSHQSQISQNSQKPKLTHGDSYASDFPEDTYDKKNSYTQLGRKDSDSSITDDNYTKSVLTRNDIYQSKEHRGSTYGQVFTQPQPISRAESYQRGYFRDQESIDDTEIILGSAVNGEYRMTEEELDRYITI